MHYNKGFTTPINVNWDPHTTEIKRTWDYPSKFLKQIIYLLKKKKCT